MKRAHEELAVWQESIELVKMVYRVSSCFPKEELYGLTSQVRRAAVSVPANIAEGAARGSRREFHQFLIIARGSLSEVETLVHISRELGLMPADDEDELRGVAARVSALLAGLLGSLRRSEEGKR